LFILLPAIPWWRWQLKESPNQQQQPQLKDGAVMEYV